MKAQDRRREMLVDNSCVPIRAHINNHELQLEGNRQRFLNRLDHLRGFVRIIVDGYSNR